MRSWPLGSIVVLGLACSSGSRRLERDAANEVALGSTDGSPPITGADAAADDGAALVPPAQSYNCVATVTTDQGLGSEQPRSHQFSLSVDWGQNSFSDVATGRKLPLARTAGEWSTGDGGPTGMVTRFLPPGHTATVIYSALALRPTDVGLVGRGQGRFTRTSAGLEQRSDFQATLACTQDTTPPTLNAGPVHPLGPVTLTASELLPASARLSLSGSGLERSVSLTPTAGDDPDVVTGFNLDGIALAFGTSYSIRADSAFVDLMGNSQSDPGRISTLPDPGLLAQDGFEGDLRAFIVDDVFYPMALGSKPVQIVTRDTQPVPTGTKALMFVPDHANPSWELGCKAMPRVTFRLAIPDGASRVKAKVRDVNGQLAWRGALARPGSTIVAIDPQSIVEYDQVLDVKEQTDKLPGSDRYTYGKLRQWSLPLPPGSANEVLLDLTWSCQVTVGMIIDDLQVE